MGSSTWFMAVAMSLLVGVGGAASGTFALPLIDDAIEVVDDVADDDAGDDDDGLLDPVTGTVVEEVVAPVVWEVVDPIVDEVVDPVVEEVVEPIVEEIVEDVDDVDDVIEPDPDDDTTLPVASGTAGPSVPSEPESSPTAPQDRQVPPVPSAAVIATLEAAEQQAGSAQPAPAIDQADVESLSDDRLAAMLLKRSQPSTLGTALQPLDGVLAWLTAGPTIARLLAAPLALLDLLIRALLSAGSGLVAPLSLTAAIVVRQLYLGRQTSPVG